jgi:general secretion pathway protein K
LKTRAPWNESLGDKAVSIKANSGFALLLVIWVLALLAVLAAGMAADTWSEAKIARDRLELARAAAIAEAGISLAVLGLSTPDPAARWRPDGTTRKVDYASATLAITVQDEAGKLDLNEAPIVLIAGLLEQLDDENRASHQTILQGIQDWRANASSTTREIPERSGTLPRRRQTGGAGAAAFASLSELRSVRGITRNLYERLRPFITVYSRSATFNPLTAPREVLLTLPDVNPQSVELYIQARNAVPTGQISAGMPSLGAGAADYIGVTDLVAVTITSRAETSTGIAFGREAVVALDPGALPPFSYLEWRRSFEEEAAFSEPHH